MNDPYACLTRVAQVLPAPGLPWPATQPHLVARKRLACAPVAEDIMAHLWPETIRRSVPARRYEYVVARLAAACLLARLGIGPQGRWIASEGRRPVWPEGLMGSISHSENLVAVVAALREPGLGGLGIDIEPLSAAQLEEEQTLCFTREEILKLRPIQHGLLAGFSAKESLFKCLSAEAGGYFDFLDAEIAAVDERHGHFEIRLRRDLSPRLPRGARFWAWYRFAHAHVWTGVTWRFGDAQPPLSSLYNPCASGRN